MPTYRCKKCNYLYIDDEKQVHFEKLDDEYRCPKCRSSKKMFVKKSNS
ncbi:MAG: rubredoxin [Candidatus Hodarchaeota archaeon]